MKFKSLLSIVLILMMPIPTWVSAKYTQPLLALDMQNLSALPKHFRTTSDALPSGINTKGMTELHIAGGAQFSSLALEKIIKHLKTNKLTVIDLRQESHGFLDGNAISWYGPWNAANASKTPNEIETDQSQRLKYLNQQSSVTAYKILEKSKAGEVARIKPVEFVMHQTSTEKEKVIHSHLHYQRLYIQDFHAPLDKQIDSFISMVNQLPKDEWVYFHCRAGVGRTTTFMVMFDIMRNAKHVTLEDILKRQIALGGKDLRKMPARDLHKYQWAVERMHFIKKFYQYARENEDNFATSWSEWMIKS